MRKNILLLQWDVQFDGALKFLDNDYNLFEVRLGPGMIWKILFSATVSSYIQYGPSTLCIWVVLFNNVPTPMHCLKCWTRPQFQVIGLPANSAKLLGNKEKWENLGRDFKKNVCFLQCITRILNKKKFLTQFPTITSNDVIGNF